MRLRHPGRRTDGDEGVREQGPQVLDVRQQPDVPVLPVVRRPVRQLVDVELKFRVDVAGGVVVEVGALRPCEAAV